MMFDRLAVDIQKIVRKATPQPSTSPTKVSRTFVGEEAPVARVGPRSPDVFYRGEEAGAVLKAPYG